MGTGDTGSTFFGPAPGPLKTRRASVAAEIGPWDFAPSGRDDRCGFTLPPSLPSRTAPAPSSVNSPPPKRPTPSAPSPIPRLTVLPRAAVGVSRAPAEAFLGLPAAPHSIRSDRAEACLNRGDMGAPDDFAVNGQTVRLRLGDRGPTLQLNANGSGKSAQS